MRGIQWITDHKKSAAVAAYYLLLAWTFANVYDYVLPRNMDVTLEQLANFTARKPMMFRVLVPELLHSFVRFTPLALATANKLVTIAAVFVILILFARWLAEYLERPIAYLIAPVILVPLYWNYCMLTFTHYPSDLPGIAFFLLLLQLWKARWLPALYASFMFACLNSERILFVLPCILVLSWREEGWKLARVIVPLVGLYAVLRFGLELCFLDNLGSGFENHASYNLHVITHLFTIGQGVLRFVFFIFGGMHLVAFALYRWLPSNIRKLVLLSILYLVAMVIVGVLLEGRIYSELVPIYCIATILGVTQLLMPDWMLTNKKEPPALGSSFSQ